MSEISYKREFLRKAIHLSSLWIPCVILFYSRAFTTRFFASFFIINLIFEYGFYRKIPFFIKTYGAIFHEVLREDEESKRTFCPSGSPYILAAAFLCCFLFPALEAATAMTVMLISDAFAALIGRRFGKHKLNTGKKSVEGALAFFLSGMSVIFLMALGFQQEISFIQNGFLGVFLAMLAEIYEDKIRVDDNFSIPILVGFCLSYEIIFSFF